jgi:hypothetical protein
MGAFKKGQRVRVVRGNQRIPQLDKYIGSEGKVGREPRESRYYVRLDKLGMFEYFPEDWLELLRE